MNESPPKPLPICTVSVAFNGAKRLTQFQGACNQLHGYQHWVEVSLQGDLVDNKVIDFNEMKDKLATWLDDHWDHTVILHEDDKILGEAIAKKTGQIIYYTPSDPTAEYMAGFIKYELCPTLFPNVSCIKVRLFDTEDAWVEA